MKKTALLLAFLMIATIFAACGGGGSTAGSTTGDATGGSVGNTGEPVEISIAYWDMVDLSTDAWGQRILDKFNVSIVTNTLSWENAAEQLQTMAASDDLPNFFTEYGLNFEWQEQEILRDVPEEMMAKYPQVKSMNDSMPYIQAVKELTGKYFFLIRPESVQNLYQSDRTGIYYRKDWLENVGISKVPETLDEYYAMLRAFTENDPDGNGANDTFGLSMHTLNMCLFPAFDAAPDKWVKEGGKWIPGYMSDNNIPALQYYRDLFAEGLLEPEFLKNSYNEAIGKLAQGHVGSLMRNSDSMWFHTTLTAFGDANPDKENPLDYITCMPPLKRDAQSEPQFGMDAANCGTMISAKTTDIQLEKLLEIYEYLISPEGLEYRRFGQEGVDFRKEGEDYVVLLEPIEGVAENKLLVSTYPSQVFGWFADWDMDFDAVIPGNPGIPNDYKEEHMSFRTLYNEAARNDNIAITFAPTPAKNKLAIDYKASFSQIITGDGDVTAMFDEFRNDARNKGVDTAIEEVNALVQERGLE